MTEFLKRHSTSAVLWWPVLLRCTCWVVAEVSVAAVALLNEMLKQEGTTGKIGWSIFALALLGKAAMTIRLFLDQSVSHHADKLDADENTTTKSVSVSVTEAKPAPTDGKPDPSPGPLNAPAI